MKSNFVINKLKIMKKVILLVRVSTEYQNYDAQRNELIEYAKKDGYTDDEMIVIEDKESATKLTDEERKGLNKLFAAIKEHPIQVVYAWELTRLSRRPVTLYKIRDLLIEKGINLKTKRETLQMLVDDKVDTNFNIHFAIYIAFCENEGIQRVERTIRSKKELATKAHFNGGFVRYGYQVNSNKDLELHPQQAQVIRTAFELYSTGKYGTVKLHKELIKRGIDIQERTLQSVLQSREYTGELMPEQHYTIRGKEVNLYARRYPKIIDTELFEKCREVAKTNNNNLDKSKTVYYANKLIKCNLCGRNMQAARTAGSYFCKHKYKQLCTCTDTININVMDTVLWNVARDMEHANLSSEHFAAIEEIKRQISELNNKIDNCDKRYNNKLDDKCKSLSKMLSTYSDDQILKLAVPELASFKIDLENEKEDYQNQVKQLIVRMKELQKQYNSADSNLENYANIYQLIDTYDDKQKYDCIHKHIKEVRIKEENNAKIITVERFNDGSDCGDIEGLSSIGNMYFTEDMSDMIDFNENIAIKTFKYEDKRLYEYHSFNKLYTEIEVVKRLSKR